MAVHSNPCKPVAPHFSYVKVKSLSECLSPLTSRVKHKTALSNYGWPELKVANCDVKISESNLNVKLQASLRGAF